jgi:hypothetical protein
MPGSATANLLQKSSLELAARAVLAFCLSLWISALLSPGLLEGLLHYYETIVYLLDDHYWTEFSLIHQISNDKMGGDLIVLGRAEVMKAFNVSAANTVYTLYPGNAFSCSTAIGTIMQPAVMLVGLLLGWPLASAKAVLARGVFGAMALALWLLVGIPVSLWIFFYDMPIRAFVPSEVLLSSIITRFLFNGGGLILGGLLAAAVLAAAARWTGDAAKSNDLPH